MDAEIIIILVAVALSILSGINKNKKKTQSGSPGMPQELPEEEDPWSAIRKYIEEARSENSTADDDDEVSRNRAEQRSIRPEVAEPAPHPEQDAYMASLRDYMHKKEKDTGGRETTKKRTTARIQAPKEMPEVTPDIVSDDVMEDFDLRKAVIYSEILQPKFEEI
ncbi:MAG: hypothetical protein LIO85_04540 [Rikenellaceae bacterium]|nr:hypothetical protein [Rikenellaceae bacterium]